MNLKRKVSAGLRLLRSRLTENSAILLYHRVAEERVDPFGVCVTPSSFDEQMAALRRVGRPLAFDDFLQRHREGKLERGSVCVTFDDGFIDVFENALPILEKYEIPAVIYCVTGNPGEPFWWDRLTTLVGEADVLPPVIELKAEARPGEPLDRVSFATRGLSVAAVVKQVYPFFRRLAPFERSRQFSELARLTGQSPELPPVSARLMTPEELRAISQHPLITIGAHTVSHTSLASLPPVEQQREIESSLRELTAITGRPVTTFSYPHGLRGRDYTAETIQAAQCAGLDHALAADLGVVTARSHPFCLPRLWVHDGSGATVERKLRLWNCSSRAREDRQSADRSRAAGNSRPKHPAAREISARH